MEMLWALLNPFHVSVSNVLSKAIKAMIGSHKKYLKPYGGKLLGVGKRRCFGIQNGRWGRALSPSTTSLLPIIVIKAAFLPKKYLK